MSSIKETIQKLLRLAERGGTEAEAKAAMDKAQLLLAKHSMSMADIESHDPEAGEKVVVDESTPAAQVNCYWQDALWSSIAQLYFCEVLMLGSLSYRRYAIIGRPSNIEVVKFIAIYVLNTAKRDATAAYRAAAEPLAREGIALSIRPWKTSFLIGFSERIAERCQDSIRKAKAREILDETGTALVLAPVYDRESKAVALVVQSKFPKLSKYGKKANVRSRGAFQAGQTAADDVELEHHRRAESGIRLLGA